MQSVNADTHTEHPTQFTQSNQDLYFFSRLTLTTWERKKLAFRKLYIDMVNKKSLPLCALVEPEPGHIGREVCKYRQKSVYNMSEGVGSGILAVSCTILEFLKLSLLILASIHFVPDHWSLQHVYF